MLRLIALAGGIVWAAPAWAHAGEAHEAREIGWTFDAQITAPLLAVVALYGFGLARLRKRASLGRQRLGRQAGLFLAGWLLLAGALVSPLHEGGEVSFALHMIEHELIMLPAALLLVAGRPGPALLWGLPVTVRRALRPLLTARLWSVIASPVMATALQGLVMIVWHIPGPFDLALRHESWHVAQHVCFVASALMFWWGMLGVGRARGGPLVAAICLFATSMLGGGLGALMALDLTPWYGAYADLGMTPFGLTPAEDQQLAGLIMWVPGGLFHLAAALLFFARSLRSAPERLDDRVGRRGEAA